MKELEIKSCIYFDDIWIPLDEIQGVYPTLRVFLSSEKTLVGENLYSIELYGNARLYMEFYSNEDKEIAENRLKDLLRIFKPVEDFDYGDEVY